MGFFVSKMGRFSNLPKDVAWLILRPLIIRDLLKRYGLSHCSSAAYKFVEHPQVNHRDNLILTKYACLSRKMLELIKSKTSMHKEGWSFS